MKRVLFYLFYDADGVVDDFVTYKLGKLRPYFDEIVIVSNGFLADESRARLEPVADEVLDRENHGFDPAAFEFAMAHLGVDRLFEFDEVQFMNNTIFAPVGDVGPLFDRIDATEGSVWGITEHGAYRGEGSDPIVIPRHIQSYWYGIRLGEVSRRDFESFWLSIGTIETYAAAVSDYEIKITKHFEALGYVVAAVFPIREGDSAHPIFDNAEAMLERGVSLLKRRPFFQEPLYLFENSVALDRIMNLVRRTQYPEELVWRNLLRTTPLRTLHFNARLETLVGDVALRGISENHKPSLAVFAHISRTSGIDEVLGTVAAAAQHSRLIVLTTSVDDPKPVRDAVEALSLGVPVHVRTVWRNFTPVAAAIGYLDDYPEASDVELVMTVHDQLPHGVREQLARELVCAAHSDLVGSPDRFSRVVELFDDEPSLGLAFPDPEHPFDPRSGNRWGPDYTRALEIAQRLELDREVSAESPIAPFSGMLIARREVFDRLRTASWSTGSFDDESETPSAGVSTSGALLRLLPEVAASLGFYSKIVVSEATVQRRRIGDRLALSLLTEGLDGGSPRHAFAHLSQLRVAAAAWSEFRASLAGRITANARKVGAKLLRRGR